MKIQKNDPIFKELNEEQLRVVTEAKGFSLVLAGAGSGKTRTLIYRIYELIKGGLFPENIMLITFTNKAANEMLNRAYRLLGNQNTFLYGGTFHRIANIFLRQFGGLIFIKRDYTIADTEDQLRMIRDILKDLKGLKKELNKPKLILRLISMAINTQRDIEDIIKDSAPNLSKYTENIRVISKAYQGIKIVNNVLDFDDLLVKWLELLDHPSYKKFIGNNIKYILVDEYQDTNRLQFNILKKLGNVCGNIMVVGDDAQSIYSFRGADINNILDFQNNFKGANIFSLTYNYRSTIEILNLANDSLRHNLNQFPKELISMRGNGIKPNVVKAPDQVYEARFIVYEIKKQMANGIEAENIAVLFRSRYQCARLEIELSNANINYIVRGGIGFFEQAHIKDMVSFLQLIKNPENRLAFVRLITLFKGIGSITANKLFEYFKADIGVNNIIQRKIKGNIVDSYTWFISMYKKAKKLNNPHKILKYFFDEFYKDYGDSEYDNWHIRSKDYEELLNIACDCETIDEFLETATLEPQYVGDNKGKKGIVLSTIHQAKGLEWQCVFIMGVNKGIFPDERNNTGRLLEEERRLFYVAVTRCKDYLYITYPEYIQKNYYFVTAEPSKFLKELNKKLYNAWVIEDRDLNTLV